MTQQTDRLNASLAGRYRIERHLGEGGMASVYLCEDLKHDRKVALKLLKPELAAVLGADRFVVEIKTTAAMQHPHILPLFDSGTADGFLFYVMPYIEGETLRDKLNRETQLGVDEAVRIACEVLDALEYAHQHGIVHRDVKPENILLHGGHAMVADFGIALAVSAAAGGRMTETGLSLGTPHYMSPEQATAEKEITARSDVYSLGSVVFEMLTGNPPFTGAAAQQIIMKIITEPAEPVTKYRKSVPPNVAAAVATSLEKLPADRFESAHAFSEALRNPGYTSASVGAASGGAARVTRGVSMRAFVLVAATTLVLLATTIFEWRAASRTETGNAARFRVALPPDVHLNNSFITISPDSRFFVFQGVRAGNTVLYLRALDDSMPRAVQGTEGASTAFVSPDGLWLGYFVQGQLFKIQVAGGAAVLLGQANVARGVAWTNRDELVIGQSISALQSMPATGGSLTRVAPLDSAHGETGQRWPLALDDGETVLYQSVLTGTAARAGFTIGVASLTKHTSKLLDLPGALMPLAVLDGHLVYSTVDGSLMAVPFDSRSARVTGAPVPVGEGLAPSIGGSAAISRTGSLVYLGGSATSELALYDLHGAEKVLVPERKLYSYPRFSPDGKRIAYGVTSANGTDLWIYDLATNTPVRVTTEGNNDRPEWTPDGKRVLYYSTNRPGFRAGTLWWQPSDGSGSPTMLQGHPKSSVNEGAISPDGHYLIYRLNGGGVLEDLWYRRLDGDTASKPIVANTKFLEYAPRVSPDGKWIAYSSTQSGTAEIYVQPFPDLGARDAGSAGGGMMPLWSRDGRHIYYVMNEQLWVATVSTAPGFAVTSREALTVGTHNFGSPVHANYDVSPDGQHLLMLKPSGSEDPLMFVHDWKYELRRRMAQGEKK